VNHFLLPDNLQKKSEACQIPGLVEKTATAKMNINAPQNRRGIKS